MGNERYFDENVIDYDKFRPDYCDELFKDILSYAEITSSSRILEIGCGTGKATLPFIESGADITALEMGKNLANFAAEKFRSHNNFHIVNTRFEEYTPDGLFDLIVSATAFHWIPDSYGYPRCKELLCEGGVLATFWNTPKISKRNMELYESIETLYKRYFKGENPQTYEERCTSTQNKFSLCGFQDITFKLYYGKRSFTANEYIGLLGTYSDHMALPKKERETFFHSMHMEISKHGVIEINDTMDLHMGRKI